MISRHDTRRSLGVAYPRDMDNRKCNKVQCSKKHFTILFGKLNSISFFFVVLIMKTNVVSYKLLTTSNHRSVQMYNSDNGAFLNSSVIRSTPVLESPNMNSNPITSSEVALRTNVSFLTVYGMLSTNGIQLLPTTATSNIVKHSDLHYLSNKNTNALRHHDKAKDININSKQHRVIQNVYNLRWKPEC